MGESTGNVRLTWMATALVILGEPDRALVSAVLAIIDRIAASARRTRAAVLG